MTIPDGDISTVSLPTAAVRPSIEALTALFAALIGFGLINLLRESVTFDGLWHLPFLVSLTLFLRFLIGSV